MNKVILIVFSGLLAVQLVSAQSHTTWAAAQVPGLGRMTTPPADFPDHVIDFAVSQIITAPTENKAAYAAARVYNPVLDMADKVQQALERRVLQLRYPNGLPYPGFKPQIDVMIDLVIPAYYKTLNINARQQKGRFGTQSANPWAGASQPVGPPARQPAPSPPAGPPAGPAMGPPTSIRRGFRPRGAAGMYSPFEPTQWELNQAVHDIHLAKTEAQAVKAAAGVHRIGLDLADMVVNALEEKIARLRNPHWNRYHPPPIPRRLDVHRLVRDAVFEIQRVERAKAQAAAAAAAKEKKTPPPPSPRAGSRVPTTMPPTAPPKPNQNPRKPSNPRPRPSPKKTKPSRGDFMTDFIQNRRKQRQPPPAPKLFKQAHITRPPYVQPVRRQTVDPFLTQPPVPKYFEPTKITRPPFVPPARREPVDPFLSQSSYRPKPQAEPFRPPPNVPTPPKINWHKKAALRPVPTSIAPTTAEKGPSSISASSIPEQTSSNSYKSPSAVSYETVANQKSAKPAFMRIPKPNIPPAPFRSEPPKPISLFSKGNSGRPSDIPKAVLSSNKGNVKKPSRETIAPSIESTETTPSPEEQQLFNRYPGLFENKAKMRAANLAQHRLEAVGPSAEISKPPLKVPSPQSPKVPKKIPVTNPPQQAALKVAPKIIKPSKVWSPLGNLGSNINEILKFSIDGPSESVPIPTAAPLTTKAPTTTTKKPTTTARRKQQKVKPIRKTKVKRRRKVVSKAKSKSIAIKLAKKKEEIPKKPKGADKLTQLHKLLEGISPSQLQTLVDLIKAKANEGKPKPLPKSESLPKPKPIFAPPPPPGSEHKGPPREFRQMQNSRSGPYRPNGDYGPPPDSRGPPPDWARGPGGRSRGPPGPPGPGGPRGPGGPGGPGMRGGPDLNNPQIARLIRVIKTGGHPKHNFLSGRTPGSSAAAAGGEAPEAGEGPTGLLGNPLMMSMLMNRGGQGGGGGIASLLGGAAGGANPLAALMPGGAGGAGGGEGGMNPAMLAAIMGGGQGGGGGLGALGSLFGGGSAGGLGGLGAAMMNPDGPDFLTSGGPAMTALLSAAASGQTPSNSADPQPTAGASTNSLSTGAAAYPSKTSEANAAITDALNSINSGQKLSANTIQKTAEPTATLVIKPTPVKPKKPRGKGKRQQRWGPKKSKVIKPPSQISDPFSGSQEKTSGTNQVQGQQISWKPSPFPIPDLQTNVNDQQQSGKAPRWQQKRRNMFNNRRKQNQFQRKQDRMGVKGQGKNRQSINVGSLSTTDMLGKFKPTQQTWQITKGKPKMPRNNNNRGISVGFPRSNQKSNKPGRPDKRGRGKKPQDPKGSGKTIGDMMQNLFKGGAPPGATGGMPNMPGPLGGGGDAAGLGALLGLGGSGDLPMMPPGQSGAGGLEALFGMGGGAGQGAGGGEGLGGLGALMGLGGAGGSGSNPLEALLGAGGTGSGSNPLQALLGAGGTGSGSNPLEALLGAGGTGSGSNPLEALLGAGGAGSGSNPLEALLGAGGAGAGSNPLDALLGGGGAGSSDPLSGLFGKEKPGKPGKPGRGRPPFGKPPFGKPPFGKPPFGKPPFGKPFPPPKGGPGSLLPFLGRNPMGPGRPLIPGMTPGQVSDLMGGQPGPVPMDIANQADLMSKMGHTVDHIVDVLGDVLQQRRSMPGYAAAALAAGSFPGMGLGNPGGQGKPGRKQGRHV